MFEHVWVLIAVLLIKDADRVDNCAGMPGHFNNLGQSMLTCVIAAITDQDEHFLVATALIEMIESHGYRIVECGLSNRLNIGKPELN